MIKILEIAKEITNPYSLVALAFLILLWLFLAVLRRTGIQRGQSGYKIIRYLMTLVALITIITLLIVFGPKAYEVYHGNTVPSAPKPEGRPNPRVSLPQTQAKTSIPQPVITCILDEHPLKKGFLLFTVKNEGRTPAKSVSVDCLTMRYLWKEQKIKIIIGAPTNRFEYNEPGHNWLFIPQLGPNEVSPMLTGESVWPDKSTCVNILYFRVTFLTPEMASREKTCIYFVEGDQIYSYAEYKTHKQFPLIDLEIKRALAEDVPNFYMLGKHKRQ